MSIQFDGTNYLTSTGRPLTTEVTTEFTAFVWWYTATEPGEAFTNIAGDANLTLTPGHAFLYDGRSAKDQYVVATNNGAGASAAVIGPTNSVLNATWQSLLTTWKRNDFHHFYIDGAEPTAAVATADSDFDVSSSVFTVGSRASVGGGLARAGDRIAALCYWNRVLTSEERADLADGLNPWEITDGLIWATKFLTEDDLTDTVNGVVLTKQGSGALVTAENPPLHAGTTPGGGGPPHMAELIMRADGGDAWAIAQIILR